MTTPPLVRVVLWMTGTLLSFSAMAVSIRELVARLTIFEILTIRSSIGLLVLLALLMVRADLRGQTRPRRMRIHLIRNSVHFASQYCWSLSLTLLPLATVFSLEFTMPAWTVVLAALLLHERLTPSRIGAVAFGLIGVLVILRPGLAAFNPAALLVLLAAFGFAITMITTKQLTGTESTFSIIFWMNLIQVPLGLAGSAPSAYLTLGWQHLPAVLGVGLAGLTSHYCLSNAFRSGDATVVVPLDFLRIPLIALVGWAFYSEALDLFVFAGAGIIISGVIWNLRAEAIRLH